MQEEKKYPLFKAIGKVAPCLIPELPFYRRELSDNPEIETAGANPDSQRVSGPKGLTIQFPANGVYDVSEDMAVPDNLKAAVVDILKNHPQNGILFKEYDPQQDPVIMRRHEIEELEKLRQEKAEREAKAAPDDAKRAAAAATK